MANLMVGMVGFLRIPIEYNVLIGIGQLSAQFGGVNEMPHQPPRPRKPYPPRELQRLKTLAKRQPEVARVGFTTTEDGQWALMVWVREATDFPISRIEERRGDYQVVYTWEPDYPPIARPAYPEKGE